MASRVFGIDLGAYSVKVVVANPGFRSASVVDYVERPVPAGEEPHEKRAARVLGEIVREWKLDGDTPYAAVFGDQVFIHVLDFPFRSLRRPELAKAVGAELENILPIDLDEMVFAFDDLPRDVEGAGEVVELSDADRAAGDEEPTFVQRAAPAPKPPHGRVAPPPAGMRVLACAMRTARARELLSGYGAQGAEPRGLVAAPASYMRLAESIAAIQDSKAGGAPAAVIDIGHARTDVCVVKDGRAIFARTIARGGRDLTDAIAHSWGLSPEDAEQAKHQDGFVASVAEPASSDAWQRVHDVLASELRPLARDLRKTLTACRARSGAVVGRAVVVGGTSRLRGLASFLAEELHIGVSTLTPADSQQILGAALAQQGAWADTAALAAGVAFEGATGRPTFDLRQGDLAPRADLSFLRAKMPQLATAALVVIAFAVANAYAAYYKLREAEKILAERVAVETAEAFGEPLEASAALARVAEKATPAQLPIPELTAYDVLLIVNEKLPDRGQAAIEVEEIDIEAGSITLEAAAEDSESTDAVAAISMVEKAMNKQECFDEVSRGDISSGPEGAKSFSLTIETSCR